MWNDNDGTAKPWLRKYISDQQDVASYWNQPDILLTDTTNATPEQVRKDPMAGWGGWTPDGMIELIDDFRRKVSLCDGTPSRERFDATVMELGCGGGQICWSWHTYKERYGLVGDIIGIDHAPGAIEVAQIRMPDESFYCVGADDTVELAKLFGWGGIDVIYTLTCLQHNSAHKLKLIFDNVHRLLAEGGFLWLVNELTIDSEAYVGVYHPEAEMSPWLTDLRGSHGTATWWIGFIADHGFELLSYEKSSYIFRRI